MIGIKSHARLLLRKLIEKKNKKTRNSCWRKWKRNWINLFKENKTITKRIKRIKIKNNRKRQNIIKRAKIIKITRKHRLKKNKFHQVLDWSLHINWLSWWSKPKKKNKLINRIRRKCKNKRHHRSQESKAKANRSQPRIRRRQGLKQ